MPLIYSLDLRKKAVSEYENGEGTQTEIAKRFSIGLRTFQEWLVLKKETGSLEPKEYVYCGRKPVIGEKGFLFLKKIVEGKPDILISEIRTSYKKRFKISVAHWGFVVMTNSENGLGVCEHLIYEVSGKEHPCASEKFLKLL